MARIGKFSKGCGKSSRQARRNRGRALDRLFRRDCLHIHANRDDVFSFGPQVEAEEVIGIEGFIMRFASSLAFDRRRPSPSRAQGRLLIRIHDANRQAERVFRYGCVPIGDVLTGDRLLLLAQTSGKCCSVFLKLAA